MNIDFTLLCLIIWVLVLRFRIYFVIKNQSFVRVSVYLLSFFVLYLGFPFSCIVVNANPHSFLDDSRDLQERDKRWSYEEMKKRRDLKRSNFFYTGLGFSISGVAFQMDKNDQVISNGFLTQSPLLGTIMRLGYEHSKNYFYFATELYGQALFSTDSGGLIGSLTLGDSISLGDFGKGILGVGLNLKPGFSFNNNKGAIYLIAGVGYQWIGGNYHTGTSDIEFTMNGFGLNYGLGMKYTLHNVVMLFFDFVAVAPIRGNGAVGFDRTAVDHSGNRVQNIAALEDYGINIGLDFRV